MAEPRQILELLGTRDSSRIFVLGSNERRITIHAQQCRALNLAWALNETGVITPEAEPSVAVVGGGIAGATFAAAAASLGARVLVLEAASRIMHVQAGSHSRWLHPHIYDWPLLGWQSPNAGLPVLNWFAAPAGEVVAQLRDEWSEHQARFDIGVEHGVSIEHCVSDGDRVQLAWNPGYTLNDFDIAVLAVGFGTEPNTAYSTSYWHDDDLHQLASQRILVSGCGDGGLTDVLRVSVQDFEQSELPTLLQLTAAEAVAKALAFEKSADADPEAVTAFYRNIDVPELRAHLAERAGGNGNEVCLNSTGTHPLDRRSSPVVRLLVAQLLELGLDYLPGTVAEVRPANGGVSAVIERADGHHDTREFDRVVLRHGPAADPLSAFTVAPNLERATARTLAISTDLARSPAWNEATFPQFAASFDAREPAVPRPPAAWRELANADLDQLRNAAWGPQLVEFFEGRDPTWGDVLPGRAPERALLSDLLGALRAVLTDDGPGAVCRLGGAGGEGKSTLLMQVVVRLLQDASAPVVVWRAGGRGGGLPWNVLEHTARNRPIVVAADRAHEFKNELLHGVKSHRFGEVIASRTAPICVLIAASDVDWRPRPKENWNKLTALSVRDVRGLTLDDARAIVRGLEESVDPARALGELARHATREARARALYYSAKTRVDDTRPSALLGALLEQRTGSALEEHVHRLLLGMRDAEIEAGYTQLRAYLQVGALQFHGLGPIDRETIAEALDVDYASVGRIVAAPLRTEIDIQGTGMRFQLRIRHDAIARAVFEVALGDTSIRNVLIDVHYDTVRAVVVLNPDGWRDPVLREVFYLGRRLVREAPDVAVAAARGAYAGAPDNLYLIVSLASVLREAKTTPDSAEEARLLLSNTFDDLDEVSAETKRLNERPFLAEWATCTGVAQTTVTSAAESLCLGVLSISDVPSAPLRRADVRAGLGEVGRALLDLAKHAPDEWPASRFLPAVVSLTSAVRDRYAKTYRKATGGAASPSIKSATESLAAALRAAQELVTDERLARGGELTSGVSLNALFAHVHAAVR